MNCNTTNSYLSINVECAIYDTVRSVDILSVNSSITYSNSPNGSIIHAVVNASGDGLLVGALYSIASASLNVTGSRITTNGSDSPGIVLQESDYCIFLSNR